MRSHSPEMTTRVSSSATVAREKCSRNKRKFRQDPPFSNSGSGDENHSGGNNAGATTVSNEGDDWMPESRSTELASAKSGCAVSGQKESDSGTNSASSKSETARFYQEHLKLMRWFRSGQAKAAQAGSAAAEGKPEQSADGQSKAAEASEDDEECSELEEMVWDDCTESELEDLLVKSLGSVYNEAIIKIVAAGHSGEEAIRAVLKQGRCYGGKDAVSNIVETSLAYLGGSKPHAAEGGDQSFCDLKELQKYSLTEMVGLLREVRPLLSKGDAMWCLLMCDMNVTLACVMDDSALSPLSKEPFPGLPSNHSGQPKIGSSSAPPLPPPSDANHHSTTSTPDSSNLPSMHPPSTTIVTSPVATPPPSVPSPICPSPATLSPTTRSPSPLPSPPSDISLISLMESLPDSDSRDIKAHSTSNYEVLTTDKDSPTVTNLSAVERVVGDATNSTEMPALASLKLDENIDPRQRSSTESDKDGPTHASVICEPYSEPCRVTAQPTTQGTSAALAETPKDEEVENSDSKQRPSQLDEEVECCEFHQPMADARGSGRTMESKQPLDSDTSNTSVEAEVRRSSKNDSNCVQPENVGLVAEPQEALSTTVRFGTVDEPAVPVTAERDLSSVPPCDAESSSSEGDGGVIAGGAVQAANTVKMAPECLSKEACGTGKGEMEDQKDEMIMKLIHRARELETQLQERNEWAKQKVMQAARRLSKDLQELKALRVEREEALRLKKDKQSLEDSTMKKATDLENALRKANGLGDRANAAVHKLESENAEVRAEMEAAKLSAAEAQSTCQELTKREKKYTKRAQAWEKQKAKLQEDLSEEKKKITALQQQLVLAKERQQQAEVRWRQEEKAKEDATLRADHERRAKEQAETAAKKKEESLRRKADSNYQRHREDIQRLECEVAQFRTSAEATQLATSRWGPGVAVNPHMMELGSLQALKESNIRLSREVAELQDMAQRDVRRERECVMCMCEEMSVVFLPCAHQVVCGKCNDLHDQQGMRDCPSCRTPIKQRIRVYGITT